MALCCCLVAGVKNWPLNQQCLGKVFNLIMRNPCGNRFKGLKTILGVLLLSRFCYFHNYFFFFQNKCSEFIISDYDPKLCIGVNKIVIKNIHFLCTLKGSTCWKEVCYKLAVGKYFPK